MPLPDDDLKAKALRDPAAVFRRRELLESQPEHMRDLVKYVDQQNTIWPEWRMPDFDPAGGGSRSRVLFLLEKPGPMADRAKGSGFLSACNNDETAAATHNFAFGVNRLPIGLCLFANVIPWWDGCVAISREQRRLSRGSIGLLLSLLRDLRFIVLVGGTAQKTWQRSELATPAGVTIMKSPHPSPVVRGTRPEMWKTIPFCWPTREMIEDAQERGRR